MTPEKQPKQIPIKDAEVEPDLDIDLSKSLLAPKPAADADPKSPDVTENKLTDAVVDDIIVHEGDELLAKHDAGVAAANEVVNKKHVGLKARLADFFSAWWHTKIARYVTLGVLALVLITLGALPPTRYFILNTAHARAGASLSIIDNTNQLPLKNVAVTVGGHTAKTNQDGVVKLSGLKLGKQTLVINQIGFAAIRQTVTLGWGSNPLGDFTLHAVGSQFHFKLVDYLSGKPVKDAEISSGDSNAQADKNGQLVLTVDQRSDSGQQAKISADGYRSETVKLDATSGENKSVVLVPAPPEVYISKQSGKYDLYKMDIDGKNKKLLLAGSGFEDGNITVAQHGGDEVALISKRDNMRNQDGYALQSLTLIDLAKGETLTLDHSEGISIVDWIGTKLIYAKVKAGTSAGNPERYQLMSYDYDTTSRLQIASGNYFQSVISMQGALYVTELNNYQGGVSQLVRINPDSTGKQVLLEKVDIWSIGRTSYDSLEFVGLPGNYTYKVGDVAAKKVSDSTTINGNADFYLDSADGKRAAWADSRDGKGVLLVHDAATNKDTVLATQTGLAAPLRWLNARTIVYRVTTPAETADYAISLDGGAAKKITDLTGTKGFGFWAQF